MTRETEVVTVKCPFSVTLVLVKHSVSKGTRKVSHLWAKMSYLIGSEAPSTAMGPTTIDMLFSSIFLSMTGSQWVNWLSSAESDNNRSPLVSSQSHSNRAAVHGSWRLVELNRNKLFKFKLSMHCVAKIRGAQIT